MNEATKRAIEAISFVCRTTLDKYLQDPNTVRPGSRARIECAVARLKDANGEAITLAAARAVSETAPHEANRPR